MNFTPTPEQETLIRTLRAFARKELAPRSPHWDRSGEFPGEAWKRMGELGLFGLRAPVEHGGQEADLVTTGIAIEEIGPRRLEQHVRDPAGGAWRRDHRPERQ